MGNSRSQPIALSRGDYQALRRVHITDAGMWGVEHGTDFWLSASGLQATAGRTLITEGGWTVTSETLVVGAGADFMSLADPGVPNHWLQNAGADLVQSPVIFGDYAHAHAAAVIMGMKRLPRYLCMDAYAAFSTNSADEDTTAIGFVEDGGSIVTAADHAAAVTSNGTAGVWNISADAAVAAGGTVVGTAWNWFRIIMDQVDAVSRLWVNGVYQNSIAITADEAPYSFGFGAGTTNRILFNQVHIFYDWSLPFDPAVF